MTNTEFFREMAGAARDDAAVGWVTAEELPGEAFCAFVEHFNRRVDGELSHIAAERKELRARVAALRLPDYREFLAKLEDKAQLERLAPEQRAATPQAYRAWLKASWHPAWGAALGRLYSFPLSLRQRERHLYLVGESGSGKSELLKYLCVTDKLKRGMDARALVLIDPHGDLAEQFARQWLFSEVDRDNLIYLDPFLSEDALPTLNPFDLGGRAASGAWVDTLAQRLAGVFVSLLRGGGALTLQMETLLIPCITVLLKRPGSTLFDLQRFMDDEHNHDLLELGKRSQNEGQRQFFRTLFRAEAYRPTKVSLATKCQSLLNNQTFARLVARPRSTVDLESALDGGKTIVVNCAKGRLGAQAAEAFGRFMVALVQGIALGRGGERKPIDLVIDECQNFLGEDIETIITEARKFGLHLILAQQVAGHGMSPQLQRLILGNSAVKLMGKGGAHNTSLMAREMNADLSELLPLQTGTFILKSGSHPPVRLHVPDEYLDDRSAMSGREWAKIKREQLEKYYRVAEGRDEGQIDSTEGAKYAPPDWSDLRM